MVESKNISGYEISLRRAEPWHAKTIYEWENDTEIWSVSDTHAPYSLFQIEQSLIGDNDITRDRQLRLMICTEQHDMTGNALPCGCIDIFNYDPINQRAELGIFIKKESRGKGIGKKSLCMVVDYLFNTLLLHQIFCSISEGNTHSVKLFTDIGFEQCGIRKDWIKTPKGYRDIVDYQLINPKHLS